MLFPGAIGDLLCCWPALDALGDGGARLTLAARPDTADVLPAERLSSWSIDARELAELFGSGPLSAVTRERFAGFTRVDSFTGHADPSFAARLAAAAGDLERVHVHPFRGMRRDEPARDYYARCLGAAPRVRPLPVHADAAAWAESLWRRAHLDQRVLVIHPGSGSPAKNWEGMSRVAGAWRRNGGQVIALRGPAEIDAGTQLAEADLTLSGESLRRIAAVIARARRFLGNDSGISHLAGLIGARTVVVFGETDPRIWAPAGDDVRVLHAPSACTRCGPRRFCAHRLTEADVLAALA